MMNQFVNEQFVINYESGLERFVENSLKIYNEQKSKIQELFDCELEDISKLKISLFIDKDRFRNYVRDISGKKPPVWASGCFANGEIQVYVDINNENVVKLREYTLTHEFVHICIKKIIYDKYDISRIRWFDETYAKSLEGSLQDINLDYLKEKANKLKIISKNFNMNDLDDINKVKTDVYDGYEMFLLIGKYIFDNKLEKEYIKILKEDPNKIRNMGREILQKAIDYIDCLENDVCQKK